MAFADPLSLLAGTAIRSSLAGRPAIRTGARAPAASADPGRAQVARRRTSQTVAAMSSTDSANSQPPSIHWNAQNRVAG